MPVKEPNRAQADTITTRAAKTATRAEHNTGGEA